MIDMMEQKTILIVDDENMMREAVASYLEKQGYHVLQAETGTQAETGDGYADRNWQQDPGSALSAALPDLSADSPCRRRESL